MSTSVSTGSTGIGFGGALCIAFLVLKLCHVINWSWWWVFAPLWGPVVLIAAVIGLITTGVLIYKLLGG